MRTCKIFSLLFILSLVFAEVCQAGIKISMDYGRFRYDSSSVYLEIFYSVYAKNIEYQNTAQGLQATTTIGFDLLSENRDSVLVHDSFNITFSGEKGAEEANAQGTTGVLKMVIPMGKYIFRMYHGQDTLSSDVSATAFTGDMISLSDLELASNIITNSINKESQFYKNTMEIIPNPSLIFGKSLPRLYYYIELYNVKRTDTQPGDVVLIQAVIADADGKIRYKKEYARNHAHESMVERGAFNMRRLESGLYTLIFAVTDSSNNTAVYRRRNFYVYNPDVVLAKTEKPGEGFLDSEFSTMPEALLDQKFAQARYIATKSELNAYKILNSVETKRQFLYKFWKSRTADRPDWKDEYYKRVDYANLNFKVGSMEGWESDMGRVYILYGPPSEYERHPSGPDENPYAIWYYYEIEGGVEFNFVDLNGFGIYRLVNSTKRNEINFPDWRNYIYTR